MEKDRASKVAMIWRKTPKSMKAIIGETRHILIIKDGATTSTTLDRLTDEQIEELLKRLK